MFIKDHQISSFNNKQFEQPIFNKFLQNEFTFEIKEVKQSSINLKQQGCLKKQQMYYNNSMRYKNSKPQQPKSTKLSKNSLLFKMNKLSDLQLSYQQTNQFQEIINNYKKRFSLYQINKLIKTFFKLDKNKIQLLGGGGCCSKSGINESIFNAIKITNDVTNTNIQNIEFENEYKKWTNEETISQSIQKDVQLNFQKRLLKQCIVDQFISSEDQINNYQLEIQDIFDIYLMLEITRSSNKSDAKQEEFNEILKDIQFLEQYEQDFPIKELVFYIQLFININKVNQKFDENEQTEIKKIKELINIQI